MYAFVDMAPVPTCPALSIPHSDLLDMPEEDAFPSDYTVTCDTNYYSSLSYGTSEQQSAFSITCEVQNEEASWSGLQFCVGMYS